MDRIEWYIWHSAHTPDTQDQLNIIQEHHDTLELMFWEGPKETNDSCLARDNYRNFRVATRIGYKSSSRRHTQCVNRDRVLKMLHAQEDCGGKNASPFLIDRLNWQLTSLPEYKIRITVCRRRSRGSSLIGQQQHLLNKADREHLF